MMKSYQGYSCPGEYSNCLPDFLIDKKPNKSLIAAGVLNSDYLPERWQLLQTNFYKRFENTYANMRIRYGSLHRACIILLRVG
jgi:hypothetical protein